MASSNPKFGIKSQPRNGDVIFDRLSGLTQAFNQPVDTSTASRSKQALPPANALISTYSTHDDLLTGTMPDVAQTTQILEHSIIAGHIDTHRGTYPPPHTNPIGFERGLAHQLDHRGFPNVSIRSRNVMDAQSFGINTSDSNLPHINQEGDDNIEPPTEVTNQCNRDTSSHYGDEYTGQHSVGYALTSHDNSISAYNYQTDEDKLNSTQIINSQVGAAISHIDVVPRYHPSYYPGMQQNGQATYGGAATVHHGLATLPGEARPQNHQMMARSMQYAPAYHDKAPDNNSMNYGNYPHGTNEEIEKHNIQWNADMQLTNGYANIGRDFAIQNQEPTYGLTRPTEAINSTVPTDIVHSSNDLSDSWSDFAQMNDMLRNDQDPGDGAIALVHSILNPTRQLLRERGLMAPISAEDMSISRYVGDHEHTDHRDRVGGSLGLPHHLNCAVWVQRIPKGIDEFNLYKELYKVVSIGPIVGAHINVAGNSFSDNAAKVVFKHPEHAGRLIHIAKTFGIKIRGKNIRIEPNRFGYREHPLSLHYQSRVVIVRVKNSPNMGLDYWLNFVKALCVVKIESTRHLEYSTAKMMVMEFRFARIAGQAQVLLQGIKNCPEFEGIVFARYVPDVVCDLHHI
ncbi:hypothetical protein EYC80_010348 [Monilinia laxa]|uniref:RRM domain-containing protein n=1 Tax=Monilinia laxa TaxID=61186 RepID=A0A5N6JNI7_MONLA|nr:hypothetical protein EYC80_010348 [Monilinia laxa]